MDNYIKVTNYGDFTIRFFVIYQLDEKKYVKRTKGYSKYITLSIKIPNNAKNIQVNIEIARPQGRWSKFYHKSISVSKSACFQAAGYNYNPKCNEVSC